MHTFRKTFVWLISFPEILGGAISWVLFFNFAVSPLVQNKSVLNKKQRESRSCSLFNTTYLVLKGADTAKLQNRTQEIAIHPDKKKLNLAERGGYLQNQDCYQK